MHRLLSILSFVALYALAPLSHAAARAIEPLPRPTPPTTLVVEGALVVTSADIHVACGSFDFIGIEATCRVTARLHVRATHTTRLSFSSALAPSDTFVIDGMPLAGAHTIGEGQERELFVRVDRSLSASPHVEESPYVLSAAFTRHPLLGEHRSMGTASAGATIEILPGAHLGGTLHLDARSRGVVEVRLGERVVDSTFDTQDVGALETITLHLERDRTHEGSLANGGLFATLGVAMSLTEAREQLTAALGWELVLESAFFVSLALGTDGSAITESLIVEIASPSPLFIVPSFGAGVGVVARQLGDRAPDAALRLRLSAQTPLFLGVVCDLDYWPSIAEATLTVAARLSL